MLVQFYSKILQIVATIVIFMHDHCESLIYAVFHSQKVLDQGSHSFLILLMIYHVTRFSHVVLMFDCILCFVIVGLLCGLLQIFLYCFSTVWLMAVLFNCQCVLYLYFILLNSLYNILAHAEHAFCCISVQYFFQRSALYMLSAIDGTFLTFPEA